MRSISVSLRSGQARVNHKPPAFSLVELLVAVGIIGLLIALVLPAVQAARESARRAQCQSNLRQIGIAMSSYEALHGMFPPGYLSQGGQISFDSLDYLSGFARMLPQLEQQALFSSINTDLHGHDGPDAPVVENHTVRTALLGVFLCPSDGEPYHRNSYRFNFGRYPFGLTRLPDGPFGVTPKAAAMTDGLSRTVFLSERIGGSFRKDDPDPSRDMKLPINSNGTYQPPDDLYIAQCLEAPAKGWIFFQGRYWMYWGVSYTLYNHNGAPNDPRPWCGGEVVGLLPPRSYHPGLVNVLLGDGHVEPIRNSIQQNVWRALGTRSGGETEVED